MPVIVNLPLWGATLYRYTITFPFGVLLFKVNVPGEHIPLRESFEIDNFKILGGIVEGKELCDQEEHVTFPLINLKLDCIRISSHIISVLFENLLNLGVDGHLTELPPQLVDFGG